VLQRGIQEFPSDQILFLAVRKKLPEFDEPLVPFVIANEECRLEVFKIHS
jgi:hypothetical protein